MKNNPETMARVRFVTNLCGMDEAGQRHLLRIESSEERTLLAEVAEARSLPLLAALIRSI